MNINFELYKIFYEVANSGSISGGAKTLMISPPAVTQAIHNLESELGGKLFIRTPKGVVLTSEGRELFLFFRKVVKILKIVFIIFMFKMMRDIIILRIE